MLRVNKTTGIALVTIIVLFLLASGTHRSDFHFKSFPGAHDAASSTSTSRPRPSLVGAPTLLYPQPGGQTYPRAIKLRSGTLLATLTVQDENLNQAIQMVISHDQGLTWSPHSVVISKPATDATPVDNGFLLEMPSGRILCAFRSHTKVAELLNAEEKPGGQNEGYLYYRLIIHYSDDGGKTWEFLSTPTHEAGPAHGNWEPGLRLTNSGELQFFYSRELGGGRDQDNLIRISEDEGVSWSNATNVSGQDLVTRDGMMGIVEITPGSGHLMAVFETVQEKEDVVVFTARFEIWSVQSRDDGKTWGERKMIYAGWYGEEGAPDRTSTYFCISHIL